MGAGGLAWGWVQQTLIDGEPILPGPSLEGVVPFINRTPVSAPTRAPNRAPHAMDRAGVMALPLARPPSGAFQRAHAAAAESRHSSSSPPPHAGRDARLAAVKSRMSSTRPTAVGRAGSTGVPPQYPGVPFTSRRTTVDSARSLSESKMAAAEDALPSPPQVVSGAPPLGRAVSEDAADTDGLDEFNASVTTLLKPLLMRGELTEVLPPVPAFGDRLALWPDGGAEGSVAAGVVAEALEEDATATPAFLQLVEAAEALALRRAGIFASRAEADAAAATASGVWEARPAPVSSGNARRHARRTLREWHAGLRRAAPPGAPALPLPVDAATQASMAAALQPAAPAPSPLEQTCARLTVGPPRRTADQVPCALGLASERGAKAVAALPAARLRNFDFPEGASGVDDLGTAAIASDPSLLIRVVRPLGGDSGAAALALTEPATLKVRGGNAGYCRSFCHRPTHPPQIAVGTVALSDHPLMSREDRLATMLRDLSASYARQMAADVPSQADDRLTALLAFTHAGSAGMLPPELQQQGLRDALSRRSQASATAAARALLYDFERDSVPELCARASAVLAALSEVRAGGGRAL